jgi:hypothetical protein
VPLSCLNGYEREEALERTLWTKPVNALLMEFKAVKVDPAAMPPESDVISRPLALWVSLRAVWSQAVL